ncbi:hypothetical protein [Streptomyces odontomachi]|uniref:hypothetical protein n=1 Tax=Streptomyces odontomachi TaxID=2944940 RepID=UPI00210EE295|nr:hypothetical protein [Streptomyces sp. ODS25]
MEREQLEQLLAGDDQASVDALAALRNGGSFVVWDGAGPAESLARVYERRLRYTRRKGAETTGLERAVRLLWQHGKPVLLGQIRSADGSWSFMLFIAEDSSALVTCTGVRRTGE